MTKIRVTAECLARPLQGRSKGGEFPTHLLIGVLMIHEIQYQFCIKHEEGYRMHILSTLDLKVVASVGRLGD